MTVPWNTILLSVVLYIVVTLIAGYISRKYIIKNKGLDWFENVFLSKLSNFTVVGVLVEVPVMLALVKIANKTRKYFPGTAN